MKKQIFGLILAIFMISLVSSVSICIDKDSPTWPENSSLNLSIENNNIRVEWMEAQDEPECSGIEHYEIYRSINSGSLDYLDSTSNSEYLDENLDVGTYTYMIHSFDKAGQNEGTGISNSITLSLETPSGSSGGRGSSITSIWECGEWSECVNETQTRTCEDALGLEENKTETRECFPDFVPLSDSNETFDNNETETSQEFFLAPLTGAIIGGITNFSKSNPLPLLFITLILFAVILIIVLSKNQSKPLKTQ